ncbi:MAG: hypothetical protein Q9166_003297 [cf. Caloplaca sp. 2 TL-2023]
MSAGFGFSVGDIVAGLKLIKQSIEALQDTKGSTADYQALSHEIDSLKDGLRAVEDLSIDQHFGPKSKQSIAIQEAVSRCWYCIKIFLTTTATYQPWLQTSVPPGLGWKANLKKIQWALCKKDDVNRFRIQLERHCSSISMLLVTLQVSQSFSQSARQEHQYEVALTAHSRTLDLQKNFDQTTALMVGLNLEQRQLFQSLVESNHRLVQSNERMAYELQQMRGAVQVQNQLPPQVVLQKPVTLLDACGKVSAFHLDFINCPEALLAVLKIRFQQYGVEERGLQMLDDSLFVLEDHRGRLDLSRPWTQILRPNQKVDMSMVFHRNMPSSLCPACQWRNENDSGPAVECQSCGLYYQRVQELATESTRITEATTISNLRDMGLNYIDDCREYVSIGEHRDLIDQFRRIQLVSITPHVGEGDEADAFAGNDDQQVDRESSKHPESVPSKQNSPLVPRPKRLAAPSLNEAAIGAKRRAERHAKPLVKPRLSYVQLIHEALSTSRTGRLSLADIYRAIEGRHPFYKSEVQTIGWQSSVRHNVMKHPAFCKFECDGRVTTWGLVPEVSTEERRTTPPRRSTRSDRAAGASPLHLFDMSAALLNRVEQSQNN